MGELKKCKMCGEELPATTEYFHKNKRAKDGLQYHCKECAKELTRKNYEKNHKAIAVLNQSKQEAVFDDQFINIKNRDGILVTSSRDIAERFEKRHVDTIRAIEDIKKQGCTQNCADLFIETEYQNDQNKQRYKEYLLTRDGFSLLAMGFTGAKALKWKIKYIEAFNKMEEELRKQLAPTGKQLMAMALIEANETIENQVVLIDTLQQKISEDEPKVLFANQLAKTKELVPIGNYAKTLCHGGFEIGQNRLFQWLRDNNILTKDNLPYQQYIVNGAFEVNRYVQFKNGEYKQRSRTLITPKGQLYLFKKMLKDPGLGLAA